MWKSIFLYIKIRNNSVEITDLLSGNVVHRIAIKEFSSVRNIIGSFNNANETIRATIKDLNIKKQIFGTKTIVLMQQLEGMEGGLSDIEIRALRDLGEMVGASKVYIKTDPYVMAQDEALEFIRSYRNG